MTRRSHISKFKSFKKARDAALSDFVERGFNMESAKNFFSGYSRGRQICYSPGLYKFKSFNEAREFDMKMLIEASSKKQ